jgi:hypothetical protein
MELYLEPGENLVKAVSLDRNGAKSTTTLLRVIYTPIDDVVNDENPSEP